MVYEDLDAPPCQRVGNLLSFRATLDKHEALLATGKLSDACQACHDKYRNTPKEPEDRCLVTTAAAK